MKRIAAVATLAIALLACFPAGASAAPLQRLTVTSFTLTTDNAKPEVEHPFHLIVSLHVRENVPEIDNITLPVLVDVELLGDARMTKAGPNGTDYRETITVVAHHSGKITLAPVTLAAIDAKDGKAKQWATNPLQLDVSGPISAPPPDELTPALQSIGQSLLSVGLWVVGLAALTIVIVVLVRRRPKPAAAPPPVAAPPPRPVAPERTRRERLQDGLTVLRADRNRPTAVRVRAVVWESIGALEGETLADVLRRPEAGDPRMAGVLRALERAAFTYDGDVAPAIDAACEALERYLA